MAYTRIITVPNDDFDADGIVVLVDLAGSDASLTVSNSGLETVDSVNPVTGEIDLSAKPSFGARTLTCIQDPQWADFGGTLNAGDHPISTDQVFQLEDNTAAIDEHTVEIAELNAALLGKEDTITRSDLIDNPSSSDVATSAAVSLVNAKVDALLAESDGIYVNVDAVIYLLQNLKG